MVNCALEARDRITDIPSSQPFSSQRSDVEDVQPTNDN